MERFRNWISNHGPLLIILVFLFMLVPSCGKKEPSEIRIAAAMPLTGDGAVYGEPQRRAAALAVDEINQKGGLLGKKVVLLAHDDKALPAEAASLAHMFTSRKDIVGVLGHPNSGNAIPASKIYYEHSMPYIATSPTNPVLTQQGFDNVFRFAPTDDIQGISAAEFIFKVLKITSVVILHDNAAYGKGLATGVKKHFESLGGEVVLFDALTAGERDYRSVLSKVAAHKPEAIFYGGMMPEGAILVRQAAELGLKSKFVLGDGCFDEKFRDLAGTDCRNVYISFLAPPWKSIASAKTFAEKYQGLYGSIPPFAPYGYDAVIVLAAAIKKANSVEHDKIIKALKDPTFIVQGVTGEIKFDSNGQTTGRLFYFYTFNEGGQLVLYE